MTAHTETNTVDVLAVGAHPDDVEWGCGGIVAGLTALGARAGILVLSSGEAGTLGSARERHSEALAGAKALGVATVMFLDCGDGQLRTGPREEEQVMFVLRSLRPRLVLAPPQRDRHPDHERAATLVRSSCFYAGLRKRASRDAKGEPVLAQDLAPHRPATLLHYMLHEPYDPDLIVDCTAAWPRKIEALRAHESQFPSANGEAPIEAESTWVSKRSFWEGIEGRARHYGQRIGAEFADPLLRGSPLGLSVAQLQALHLTDEAR